MVCLQALGASCSSLQVVAMASSSSRSATLGEAILSAARKLGYSDLRQKQREAVTEFVAGKDVFVSLPTGSGKSLCFFILPLLYDILRGNTSPQCIVLVVSPLIALMKDQVSSLSEKKVESVYITQGSRSEDPSMDKVHEGFYQLVFFSPEALLCNEAWRDMLKTPVYQDNVVALVIDEAHLVKKW